MKSGEFYPDCIFTITTGIAQVYRKMVQFEICVDSPAEYQQVSMLCISKINDKVSGLRWSCNKSKITFLVHEQKPKTGVITSTHVLGATQR